MYPYPIIWDLDLYSIFLCIGVVAAVLTVRIFCDKKKIYWKLQNFCVLSARNVSNVTDKKFLPTFSSKTAEKGNCIFVSVTSSLSPF